MSKITNTSSAFDEAANSLIRSFSQEKPRRTNSLLISIYGDTICPHGGTIWLGSLIKLVKPLGINDRLVRTSVFRLGEKGILQSVQVGRKSYYSLTRLGQRQYLSASQRIYAKEFQKWKGSWQFVFTHLGGLDGSERELLCKELDWLGYARLQNGIYAHPNSDRQALQNMLSENHFQHAVSIMDAQTDSVDQTGISNKLIADCFKAQPGKVNYQEFIDVFEPILESTKNSGQLNLELSFLVRTLLIHKFRFILHNEPELPGALIGENSLTRKARALVAELYLALCVSSDGYFLRTAESGNQGFQQPQSVYYNRFASSP